MAESRHDQAGTNAPAGHLGWRSRTATRLLLSALLVRGRTYQPIALGGRIVSEGFRDSDVRLHHIDAVVEQVAATTVLDLGCAEGYFVQELARRPDTMAIGVDSSLYRLLLAQLSTAINDLNAVGYLRAEVTAPLLQRLPSFDVVICLSLLHHVAYSQGLGTATELLRAIRSRTEKALVFEMGRSDEVGFAWAKSMPAMGPDPDAWTADLLHAAGFQDVTKVGTTRSFNSDIERALFVARP